MSVATGLQIYSGKKNSFSLSSKKHSLSRLNSRISAAYFPISATFSPISTQFRGIQRSSHVAFCAVSEEETLDEPSQTVTEENSESVPSKEAGEPQTGEQTFVKEIINKLREALKSDNEADVELVEAQLEAMDKDREYLTQQVSSLTEEISAGKDRLLRLNADFENYRKRSDREKSELATSVKGDVVEMLLPMIDNFERAKSSIKTESEAEKKIENSYQSIYKQFVEAMKALGVSAVETAGKNFDPSVHDAIMKEESSEYLEGVILEEFRKGFVIGSKLLRPAMVKVSSGPGPSQKVQQPEETEVPVEEIPAEESSEVAEETATVEK